MICIPLVLPHSFVKRIKNVLDAHEKKKVEFDIASLIHRPVPASTVAGFQKHGRLKACEILASDFYIRFYSI